MKPNKPKKQQCCMCDTKGQYMLEILAGKQLCGKCLDYILSLRLLYKSGTGKLN